MTERVEGSVEVVVGPGHYDHVLNHNPAFSILPIDDEFVSKDATC